MGTYQLYIGNYNRSITKGENMSNQSFWGNPEYQKFKKYTDHLEAMHQQMGEKELKDAVKNWHRGVEKMTQLAIGYDVEYKAPAPSFLTYSEKDSITWISFKKLDGFTIGLWDGPNRTIDGKPVFDPAYLDMELAGVTKLTEMAFTEQIVAFLNVMRKFDGVVVPDVKDFF
jgi:hypothetical protein